MPGIVIARGSKWALFCALGCACTGYAESNHVLVLSETGSTPAEAQVLARIESELGREPSEVEVYRETLDIVRFPAPEQQVAVADFLRDRYSDRPIDAVLALGPASLAFLVDRRADLFPDAPIVYGGVRAASVPPELTDATGIVSSFDLVKTLDLALTLQPEARQLVVITGAAPLDLSWNARARALLEPYRDRLAITYLEGLAKAEVLAQVGVLPGDAIVILLTMQQDGLGDVFLDGPAIAREIAAAATAPVYSVYETYLGQGVVGGYVESFDAMGAAMGALTVRLLNGEQAADLPAVESAKVHAVDSRALRRFGLDEARLPPDTTTLFREPSLWGQYRSAILGVASLVGLQTLLIAALLLYIRKRRVELELRQSEDKYRHVVDAQVDLVCRYLPDTTLTFVNDAYCRCFGRTRSELLGQQFLDLLPESERQRVLDNVATVVNETQTVTYTHKALLADGSVRWQQWIDHPIVDARGHVTEIQGIGRDITELKAAEAEAQERRAQVTHLTRVAVLGELSGALAHELNQPMTAILSNAQTAEHLLRRENPDLDELREIVKDIIADDMRAGEVIRRLRTMLKPGAAVFEDLDVARLLTEVLRLVRVQLIDQHVSVVERFSTPLPSVQGDRIQLQQVLINLLLNACDAMRDNDPRARSLTISASHAGELVMVAVSDCGAGFAPQVAERLFTPFVTTKTDGLGLGLSICRSILSLHGGSIAARNNADGGATVEFTLPASLPGQRLGKSA
jgi:PAS domain S-box-containing protein